jgi:hypothetical protein
VKGKNLSLMIVGTAIILLAVLVLSTSSAMASQKEVESDDFSGSNGDPPDPLKWTVYNRESNDYIVLDNNMVKAGLVSGGWSNFGLIEEFGSKEITVIIEWKPVQLSERTFDLRLVSNNSGTTRHWCGLIYVAGGGGWAHSRVSGGTMNTYNSGTTNVVVGTWYTMNMTLKVNLLDLTVTRKSDGHVMYSQVDKAVDTPPGDLMIKFGVYGSSSSNPVAHFDDFRLYDNTLPPNIPPIWDPVPDLSATEDVTYTYDFTSYVSDPDGPFGELTLSSRSPFVSDVDGMDVTFLFPNGVLNASVPVVLADRWDQAVTDVNFTVTPVNDPPYHDVPEEHTAKEDIPYEFNFRPFVWDIDNGKDDLYLITEDPYVVVDGLNMTATFPEGIDTHEVLIEISDGELSTQLHMVFTVEPVDDPPTIEDLGTLEVIEDQVKEFDVGPYIDDVDTPLEDLRLLVRNRNCSVDGHVISILFTVGGMDHVITVQVTDGQSMVQADLAVHVVEWNDPPVASTPSPVSVVEGEATTIDLGPYIEDEDTPRGELVLECEDPAVIDVTGFNITLLYDVWVSQQEIMYTVFDGALWDNATILVQVEAVNDDPVIVSISGMVEPIDIEMDEGTTRWLTVNVEDEDSDNFMYTVDSLWDGVTAFSNGSIRLITDRGVIEDYTAMLVVRDAEGGTASVELTIAVLNVNDPPGFPEITRPQNHTVVERGADVSFVVDIDDPDIELGQVLTVTWSSNLSGQFMERTNKEGLTFTYDALPLGTQTITVKLTDGEFTKESWIKITVIEPYVEPPPDDQGNGGSGPLTGSTSMIALMVIVVLVVVVATLLITRNRKVGSSEDGGDTVAAEGPSEVVIEERSPMGRASLSVQMDEMATSTEMERSKELTGRPAAPQEAPETLEIPSHEELEGEVTQEDMEDRAHAKEVREVMKALTQLPRGLPTSLWNWDMGDLARTLVDGESRTAPDGTRLVRIDGVWYNADHRKAGPIGSP